MIIGYGKRLSSTNRPVFIPVKCQVPTFNDIANNVCKYMDMKYL